MRRLGGNGRLRASFIKGPVEKLPGLWLIHNDSVARSMPEVLSASTPSCCISAELKLTIASPAHPSQWRRLNNIRAAFMDHKCMQLKMSAISCFMQLVNAGTGAPSPPARCYQFQRRWRSGAANYVCDNRLWEDTLSVSTAEIKLASNSVNVRRRKEYEPYRICTLWLNLHVVCNTRSSDIMCWTLSEAVFDWAMIVNWII